MKKTSILVALGGAFASTLAAGVASATPQPLPFTYVYETLPKGSMEVEQYVDYTPIKVQDLTGKPVLYAATQFQTEFEYGITDHVELGLYAAIEPGDQNHQNVPPLTEGTGIKERLRVRFGEEGQLPVDMGLYGELVEYQTELELEVKLLLQKRIGDLRIASNLWGEVEYEYTNFHFDQPDWVINPTLGATYQVTPVFHPGVEAWLHAEFPAGSPPRTFNLGPQVYVGPTMMLDFGNLWWSAAFYFRTTYPDRPLNAGVDAQGNPNGTPADAFGKVWARMIIGLSF
jgi:hypothetical protein